MPLPYEYCVQLAIQFVVVASFFLFVFVLAEGVVRSKTLKPTKEINDLATALRGSEKSILAGAMTTPAGKSTEAFNYINSKLAQSIQYAINRHDWYELQRSSVFQQTITVSSLILTISITVTGILLERDMGNKGIFLCLFASIVIAMTTVLRSVWLYNSELDGNRPYRLISDIRFWYFRYNLPDRSALAGSAGNLELAKSVAAERERFFARIEANLSVPDSVREDFEQLFILQILQRSKSESLTRLRWLLSYLAAWFGIEVLATFFSITFFAQ